MTAVLGALLVAVFVLLNRWCFNQFRRPAPPEWTRRDVYSQPLTAILILTMFAGPCFFLYHFLREADPGLDVIEIVLLVATIAAAGFVYRALQRQWQGYLGETPRLELIDGGGPRPGTGHSRGTGSRHKAA
jgi:hypothetical protein